MKPDRGPAMGQMAGRSQKGSGCWRCRPHERGADESGLHSRFGPMGGPLSTVRGRLFASATSEATALGREQGVRAGEVVAHTGFEPVLLP